MKITRKKSEKSVRYTIDGKFISLDALNDFCKQFLNFEGLFAMWQKILLTGECTLDLDFDFNEKSILESKNAELQREREKNAALEKKLMQLRIKAAKYDCLVAAMKSA